MRLTFIVGFRHLDFAPDPFLHPLLAVARIGIMRRLDLSASIIGSSGLIHDLLSRFLELLPPHRFQNLYFWCGLNQRWYIGCDQSLQQPLPIAPHLLIVRGPFISRMALHHKAFT